MKQMNKVADRTEKQVTPTRDLNRAFGTILVEQGRLSAAEADQIQRHASANGIRFGEAALQLNILTQEDVAFALAQQFNYPILRRGGSGGVADDVVAAHDPQSESIEPLRALRTQLVLRWPADGGNKIFAVASPGRGEGRSWLAANLAVVFAQMGERTLLIDADMRNPSQHLLFNLNNGVGLSALLTGRGGKEIASRIHPQLRLFVVTAGSPPPNPQELLARPVFDVVLERFKEQFDVIILDTPAATQAADAHVIASSAGTALLLGRLDVTRTAHLTDAMRVLTQAGVNVIGSVFNEF